MDILQLPGNIWEIVEEEEAAVEETDTMTEEVVVEVTDMVAIVTKATVTVVIVVVEIVSVEEIDTEEIDTMEIVAVAEDLLKDDTEVVAAFAMEDSVAAV